jgi:RNA polymerase sigma-70 factor (ECF subfamily)
MESDHSHEADAALVARCLNGDDVAWESLVKTHSRRVYAICYRFTGSDHEAQDVSQEAFLRVFQSLRSFRAGEGSFVVWLTRLTRNLLIDNYRRAKLQRASDPIDDQLTFLEEKSWQGARADTKLEARETGEALRVALQKLSPELREAVVLRDLEELEYREIALAMKVPEGTVKSRINRGRTELAKVLRRMKVSA